jgi:hypothetical protein
MLNKNQQPGGHDAKVAAIAAGVRGWIGKGEPLHIHKGGVHHVVPLPNDARFQSRAGAGS